MANYIYGAVSLTGGGTGSLDSLNGADLAQSDAAIVFTPTATYIYTLDESNGGNENIPELIVPDLNAGNKRWVLVSSRAAESSCDYSTFNGILDANDDDVQKALQTMDDMFSTGDFVIAPGSVQLVPEVVKSVGTSSGTVTPENNIFNILGTGKIRTVGSGSNVTVSVDDLKIATKTSSYTVLPSDDIIVADCAGGNVELTLPQASTKSAVTVIKKSNSNTLTVGGYGSETIEGRATIDILDEYGTLRLISDGVNTWITSAQMYDLPVATGYEFGAIKVGDNLVMDDGSLTTDFSAFNQDIIPDLDVTRSLGSPTKAWKDAYIGPGSLYINGQKVIEEDAGTIVLSADDNQNVQIKTGGGGDIEFYPAGSGAIEMKGNLSIQGGKNLISNDGNPIKCTAGFDMDGRRIRNVGAPIDDNDLATKAYASNASNLTIGTLPSGLLPANYLEISKNLSDLNNAAVARSNIGLSNVPNIDCTNASNITGGTLPSSVLPPIAITTTQVAADETAMLALTTQEGDVVVRTDESKSYIKNSGSAGTMADFTELSTPVDTILSVNGQTGTVVLNQDNVGNGSTYVRTHNDFTSTLLLKLNGIESGAQVNLTAAQLKTAYESNSDTNAFTNAFQSKLNGIETGATADQTAEEIKTLYESNSNTNAFTDAFQTKLNNINTSLYLEKSDNLASLDNVTTAKTNLGLENVPNVDCTNASNITTGTLPSSVLPPIAITTTQLAASEVIMLGLTTQEGDVVVRTDLNRSYIKNAGTSGTISDFTELQTPTDSVLSVNSQTGSVVLTQDDVGNGTNFVRTANNFTNVYKTKLDNIEANATADQTAAEIKTLYESNSDTNAFTDSLETKLTNLDTSLYLQKSDNLSSLTDASAARNNIGLGNVPNVDTTNASNITTGTLPSSVLPPIAITSTQVAASEVAMLGLTTQEGDIVVRTDESKSYIKGSGTSGTMADFIELASPGDAVTSVNSQTGTVILTQDTVGDGSTYVRTTNDFTDTLLSKLNGIEANATGDQSANEILVALKTVDGSGSGLDADLLDGRNVDEASTPSTIVSRDSSNNINVANIFCNNTVLSHSQTTRTDDTVFYSGSGDYIKKNDLTGFKTSLGLENVGNYSAAIGNTGGTLVRRDGNGDFSANEITASLKGNADTATLATNATNADVATKVTVATNSGDSTCWVGLWKDSTGDLEPVTDTALTYDATTNMLSCTGSAYFSQSLVGAAGAIGMTANDGGGNANLTFNHAETIPDRNGNAGRIVVNVDATTDATMKFGLKENVASGVSVGLPIIMTIAPDGVHADTFYGALVGSADSLTTARTISLSGDASGSIGFDGSANVSIPVSVSDDSHNHTISTLPSVDEDDMVSNSASLFPTQQSVKAYVDTKVADVVNTAPEALDTLNELAAALGDDPNFATTITTSIGTKLDKSTVLTTGSGLSGGGSLDGGLTITHADTSSQASVSNAARTYIKDITLDAYGHITAIASGTETVVDTNTWRPVHDTPANAYTTTSISSNWAYVHENTLLAHGATPASSTDTIMARDAGGDTTVRYLYSSYVNMSHGLSGSTSDTVFYSSTDNFIRKNNASGFKTSLALNNVGNYSSTSSNVGNTNVLRDASGNFSAGLITATATTARFADLAEKYTCEDINLPTGTVVSACIEGDYEVKECDSKFSPRVIGVVSEHAAYIMNNDLPNSVIVGLTGKVPVRVIGPIQKGQVIIPAGGGCAKQIADNTDMWYKMGVALESNESEEEKLVYCAIK